MKRSTIVEIIAFLFIILFLYTGISKWLEYDVAREQIATTPILAPMAGVIIIVLPLLEILTALLLFIPSTRRKGLTLSLALMILFTGYVLYILNYNKELPCTCGGILQEMSWDQHLIFNTAFTSLAALAIFLNKKPKYNKENSNQASLAG